MTEEEVKEMRETTGDKFIDYQSPHFRLESGVVLYGKVGYPAAGERYHSELSDN